MSEASSSPPSAYSSANDLRQGSDNDSEMRGPPNEGEPLVPHNSPYRSVPVSQPKSPTLRKKTITLQQGATPKTSKSRHGRTKGLKVAVNESSDDKLLNGKDSNTFHDADSRVSRSPSPAEDVVMELALNTGVSNHPLTSTPIPSTSTGRGIQTQEHADRPQYLVSTSSVSEVLPSSDSSPQTDCDLTASTSSIISTHSTQSQTDLSGTDDHIQVPIVGYEIMEERARFTVSIIKL